MPRINLPKLCLGTVQLGLPYGINNSRGKPTSAETAQILNYAIKNGIGAFDTSPGYGESEKILGNHLKDRQDIIFISKVPPINWQNKSSLILRIIDVALEETLKDLHLKKLPVYLFYSLADAINREMLTLQHLRQLKKQGLIGQIGVSVYEPFEALGALKIEDLEVIQIPTNLIDKRFIKNGFLSKAAKAKKTVLVRSVFLQGLFFKKTLPAHLSAFKPYQNKIRKICTDHKIKVNELALRYALSLKGVTSVLIGLESSEQIKENVAVASRGPLDKTVLNKINKMGSAPEEIINPSLWRKLKNSLLSSSRQNSPSFLKSIYEKIIGFSPEAIFIFSAHTKEILLPHNQKQYRSTDFDDQDHYGSLGGRDRVVAASALARVFPQAKLITTSRRLYPDPQLPSHAQVAAQELIDEGINHDRIVKEENSFNSVSQVSAMLQLALENKWTKVIVISSDYQIPRLKAIYHHLEKLPGLSSKVIENFYRFSSENQGIAFVSADKILNPDPYLRNFSSSSHHRSIAYQKRLAAEKKGLDDILKGRYQIRNMFGKEKIEP